MSGVGWSKFGAFALVATLGLLAAAPVQAAEQTRHSVVGGCYALEAPSGDFVSKADGAYATDTGTGSAERFRLQATDLATYLLYDRDRELLAGGGEAPVVAAKPSPEA